MAWTPVQAAVQKGSPQAALRKQVEGLVSGTLQGQLSEAGMTRAVKRARGMGIVRLNLDPGAYRGVHVDPSAMEFYGRPDKPIQAFRISGKANSGKPGSILIRAGAETVGVRAALANNGADLNSGLHTHAPDGFHISIVRKGKGSFYIVKRTPQGRVRVIIPMHAGNAVLFRGYDIHTFHVGQGMEVLHLSTRTRNTNRVDFLKPAKQDLSALPIVTYGQYLKMMK
jgi:hypothetical protein